MAQAQNDKSIPQVVGELKQLTIDYAKQETVDPLKNLGRDVAWGVVGSVLLGAGVLFISVAILRGLQTHTDDDLTGNLNWIPYAAAVLWIGLWVGFAVWKMSAKGKDEDR